MNGEITIGSADGMLNRAAEVFNSDMQEIEEKFDDYTSLIYDGPFSQHIENSDGDLLKAEAVTGEQANAIAKSFVGKKLKGISLSGEGNGAVPTYDFDIKTADKDSNIYVRVSKNGGYVVMMLDSRPIDSVNIGIDEAAKLAQKFLINNGYVKMKQTGYIIEANSVVFAYAYIQNEFVMYPDLIKVKIALDNGETVGFEANGFLSNHRESRELPELSITKEEAAAKMNTAFQLESINKALIPLDTGKDVYCYELVGKCNGKTFLVYINTETGKEEDIKMLVESETGALTV